MTLEDVARLYLHAEPLAVPSWTLGCFRRRCITYFDGQEDVTTHVLWLQSHGLTADIRIPQTRPDLSGRTSLADCTKEELTELAKADGFIAHTAWVDGYMSWDTFATFQPYTRWPEPGRLERVGASLIEWAPSGAYVEDWRLQPGSSGLCVGLQLVSETDEDGVTRPREGGLVIAGDHALQVIGRRTAMEPGRASDQIGQVSAADVFDCSILYGRGQDAGFIVELSIDPFLVGQPIPGLEAFEMGEAGTLVQSGPEGAGWRHRTWRIDTLMPDQQRPAATPTSEAGEQWLARERDVLLP